MLAHDLQAPAHGSLVGGRVPVGEDEVETLACGRLETVAAEARHEVEERLGAEREERRDRIDDEMVVSQPETRALGQELGDGQLPDGRRPVEKDEG